MQAQPAIYSDFRFASTLEARWACFLDLMGVAWQYEVGAYDIGGRVYIPDFWLPELKIWLEIKGTIYSDEAGMRMMEKASGLAVKSGHPVILTFHDPLTAKCVTFGKTGGMYTDSHFGPCPYCGAFGLCVKTPDKARFLCPRKGEHGEVAIPAGDLHGFNRQLYDAAVSARQRKFGFVKAKG